jgi:hypothetical protein
VIAEYVWVDASNGVRSKCKVREQNSHTDSPPGDDWWQYGLLFSALGATWVLEHAPDVFPQSREAAVA